LIRADLLVSPPMTPPQYNRIISLCPDRATGRGGTDAVMILDHGTKFGPYEILEPLDGIGEVYRWRDTRLLHFFDGLRRRVPAGGK
jgi:hypothetical protein